MFHQAFGALRHHLRNPFMALWQFVKGGVDYFHIGAYNRLPDVRHFLRALVNQEDHQMHVRMVGGNGLGHLL